MEPAKLNSSSPDDDLDLLLRKTAPAPLPDGGFSARVIAALPGRRALQGDWLVGAAGAAVGSLAAWLSGASTADFWPVAGSLLGLMTPSNVLILLTAAAAAIVGIRLLTGESPLEV